MKNIMAVLIKKENREQLLKNISNVPIPEKDKILRFLKKSEYQGVRCSTTYDYIQDKSTHQSTFIHFDGDYAWDDEDIYHFEKYNLKLKDEFIEYAREKIKQSNY